MTTDSHDTNDVQHQAHHSPGRRFRRGRLAFAVFAMAFLTGSARSCDDNRPVTLSCHDLQMRIEPGECRTISNPCNESGRWASRPDIDGLELCPSEELEELFGAAGGPFSVHTTRTGRDVTRSICVRPDSPLFAFLDVDFRYGLRSQIGKGSIYLTIAPPLSVAVTAAPTSLALGETSQLVAAVHGGIPPYFYAWGPTTGLDDTDIAAPIASPQTTTEYSARVTDSSGQEVVSHVTISVGTALTVTAHPPEIGIGDVSVLFVAGGGGTPPYEVQWTSADTLDDPTSQHPSATPTTTTTYYVTAVDAAGASNTGSVTVTVRLALTATAEPPEIVAGATATLFADVRGGTPPYTFEWTPADTLDDPHRPDPIAAPMTATTYQVIVRDAVGAAAGAAVTVEVVGDDPPPTASFAFRVDCCPRLEFDASASTGDIVSYTWDLGWTSANPDRITSSPTTSFAIREFDRGPITLTVTAADGRTATTTRTF